MYKKSSVLFLPLKVRNWLQLLQNHPQGNMNRTFHELTYNDSQLGKLTRAGLKLTSTGHLTAALPVELPSQLRTVCSFYPRISSVKLSREFLVHLNVLLNIKSCAISPLFHCLVHVSKICSRHIFHKAFVSNTSFHHLSHLVFSVAIYVMNFFYVTFSTGLMSQVLYFTIFHILCFL